MAKYVGAIDQGTSSTRFVIIEISTGKLLYSHQVEFTQINYNDERRSGWAEHDPVEIMKTIHTCIDTVLTTNKISPSDISAIGITNQRETTLVWSKKTGQPLHNALVWHDTRTTGIVDRIVTQHGKGDANFLRRICGLPVSTYFSAMKLLWLIEHSSEIAAAVKSGDALFGTIDSWILYNLTGSVNGGVHITDVTNASRTMLMDVNKLAWDKHTCDLFGINMAILPKIVSNAEVYGTVTSGAAAGVKLAGCLGDQQAAMVGQLCFETGTAKNTYGTGCFMLMNTGTTAVQSKNGLLTTVAFQLGNAEKVYYALEGAIPVAGSAIQWMRDKMKLIKTAPEINDMAKEVPDNGGVYFVTAFSGLLSPYWRSDARGLIAGISHGTTRGHIARAVIEAAAWQTRDVSDAMQNDSGVKLTKLKVDGGMCQSDVLAQFQADCLQTDVVRPESLEATAAGAAYAAGLAVKAWPNLGALLKIVEPAQKPKIFNANADPKRVAKWFSQWHKAVNATFGWVPSESEEEQNGTA